MKLISNLRTGFANWIRPGGEGEYVHTMTFESDPDGPGGGDVPSYISEIVKMHEGDGDKKRWDDLPDTPAPGMDVSELSLLLALFAVNPWVNAAADRVGAAISSIKLKYKKRDPSGKWIVSDDTELQQLLENINPLQTWEDIVKLTAIDLQTVGWSLWEKSFASNDENGGTGRITGAFRRRPDRFIIDRDPEKYWKGIKLMRSGDVAVPLSPEEIVLFREWSPLRDYWPISGLFAARSAVIWDLLATTWNTALFKNGAAGLPEGIFETDRTLDRRTYDRIHKAIKNRLGHPDVWRSILLLDGGLKFRSTTRTMVEMQFQELQSNAMTRILVAMGTPPAVVGVSIQGTAGTFREQRHQFYQLKIVPLAKKIQSTINRFLAPSIAKDDKERATEKMEFDLSDILTLVEDLNAKSATLERLVTKGIMTINEVREKELGLPPVPWGFVWHAPLGLAPIGAPDRPENPGRPEGLGGAGAQETPASAAPAAEPQGVMEKGFEDDEKFGSYRLRATFCKAAMTDIRPKIAQRIAGRYRMAFDRIKELLIDDLKSRIIEPSVEKVEGDPPQFEFQSGGPLGISEEEIRTILEEELRETLLAETQRAAEPASQALGVDLTPITAADPTWQKAFDSWASKRVASSASTVSAAMADLAETTRERGLSPAAAVREIEQGLGDFIEQRINDLANSDATTFSNTALRVQAGDEFFAKQWISQRSATTRNKAGGENHFDEWPIGMHGAIALADKPFRVPSRSGTDLMDFPGDANGSPENVSHDQCSMIFLSREEWEAAPASLKQ